MLLLADQLIELQKDSFGHRICPRQGPEGDKREASENPTIAAILAFVQYTAHSVLFLSAKPTHGLEEVSVVEAMKSHHFKICGFNRSY
jgi:hypothetical protein